MTLLRFCLMLSLATALSSTLAISTVASNANSRTSANLSLKRILGFVSFEGTTSPTAQTDESSNPVEDPWEVGTRVYKDFEDFGWYFGTITSFENDEYVVTYEDGTIETYDYDSVFLDVLVDFADNYIGYDTYTLVAQEVQGGLMMGYISNFDNWIYYVSWDDGSNKTYSKILEVKAMVELAEVESDIWEDGTKVYKDFGEQGWIVGSVSWFEPVRMMYIVLYEDGLTEDYSFGSEELDVLVENADNYEPYPIGTAVLADFEEGRFSGKIINFQDWIYSVQWEDGEIDEYDVIQDVDAMVASAENGAPVPFQETDVPTEEVVDGALDPWDLGTYVYKSFPESGWMFGTVAWFDKDDNKYVILYEDGSNEMYPYDSPELDVLVDNASNYVGYPTGTEVARKFEDGWHSGTITEFNNWIYHIKWDNGSQEEYRSIMEVNAMVSAAKSGTIPPPQSSSNEESEPSEGDASSSNLEDSEVTEGKGIPNAVYAVVAVLVVVMLVVILRRRRQLQTATGRRQREEPDIEQYKDDLHPPIPTLD